MSTSTCSDTSCDMQMPKPLPQHDWLQKLTGEWESEVEISCGPDRPKAHNNARGHDRMLGGFWFVSEIASPNPAIPYSHIFTVGYDASKKKYVGTRVDNMTGILWLYEGDVEGNTLTLIAESDCPMQPGQKRWFREILELTDADTKTFSSSMKMDDGTWVDCVTGTAKRVK